MHKASSLGSDTWVAGAALSSVLMLTGCLPVVLPIPGKSRKAPYTAEQLAQVQEGVSTRDTLRQTLHNPNMKIEGDHYWIYDWTTYSGGKWVVALLPAAGAITPMSSNYFVMFLEFDQNGVLLHKEYGKAVGSGKEKKYCTSNGICIEHILVERSNNGTVNYNHAMSAVTISGKGKEALPLPTPAMNQGLVYLWPKPEDWVASHGLGVAVGEKASNWLPVGSYLAVPLEAGEQTVRFTTPQTMGPRILKLPNGYATSSFKISCKPGQILYMEIGVNSPKLGQELPIVMKPIEPDAGQKTIDELARILLP